MGQAVEGVDVVGVGGGDAVGVGDGSRSAGRGVVEAGDEVGCCRALLLLDLFELAGVVVEVEGFGGVGVGVGDAERAAEQVVCVFGNVVRGVDGSRFFGRVAENVVFEGLGDRR